MITQEFWVNSQQLFTLVLLDWSKSVVAMMFGSEFARSTKEFENTHSFNVFRSTTTILLLIVVVLFFFFADEKGKFCTNFAGQFLLQKQKFCLDQTRFFFFTASEERDMEHQREEPASGWRERDGAMERSSLWRQAELDFGAFNRKLWAGLRQEHCCRWRERDGGEGEKERAPKVGEKNDGFGKK